MHRLLPIATLLLVGACKATTPVAPATATEVLALVYKQPLALDGSAGGSQLEFSDVEDSRCPTGAQCIWAGEARVTLTLTESSTAPQQVRLGLNPGPKGPNALPDSLSVVLHRQPYWVRLLSVTPYPSLNGTPGPKVATVRLRPQ